MKVIELNHVAIHVEDVEKSCDFYANVLGLEPLPRPAFSFPGAWFKLGSQQELHIIGDRQQDVHSHNRGNHYALRVDSIQEAEARLRKKGAPYHGPQTRPDGAFQIFVQDPDGHYIELCDLSPLG
ncbi:MAG: VOC family protein [Planctomycetota bacterium]|jgi:catechol 2,3-dioxygenase-like lactoylglutathione lyase family enzyme